MLTDKEYIELIFDSAKEDHPLLCRFAGVANEILEQPELRGDAPLGMSLSDWLWAQRESFPYATEGHDGYTEAWGKTYQAVADTILQPVRERLKALLVGREFAMSAEQLHEIEEEKEGKPLRAEPTAPTELSEGEIPF